MDGRMSGGVLVWVVRDPGESIVATNTRAWFLARGTTSAKGPDAEEGASAVARALARCGTAHSLLGCGYDDAVMRALHDRA